MKDKKTPHAYDTVLEAGTRVTLLNKFGDEIADGFVDHNDGRSVELSSGDSFLIRHIKSLSGVGCVVTLNVSGAQFERAEKGQS